MQSFPGCKASTWLLVDVILCAVNICAAFYVAIQYRKRIDRNQSRGFQKARDILCYDPAIAVYIIVLIGFFIWINVGFSMMEESGSCEDGVVKIVKDCIALGFGFVGVGFLALGISLCCTCCCRGGSSGDDNAVYQIPGTANQHNQQTPAPSSHNGASYTATYGTNTNDVESNMQIPAATAVPVHVQGEPIYATVVTDPKPSAPPSEAARGNQRKSLDDEAEAAASGARVGGKLGDILNTNVKTKTKLENAGAKASVAANKGYKTIKKVVGISSNR